MVNSKDAQVHNNFFQHQFSQPEFAASYFKEYLPLELASQIDRGFINNLCSEATIITELIAAL